MNNDIDKIKDKIIKLSESPKKNYYKLLNIYKDLIILYYTLKFTE